VPPPLGPGFADLSRANGAVFDGAWSEFSRRGSQHVDVGMVAEACRLMSLGLQPTMAVDRVLAQDRAQGLPPIPS
jgi:hypothetical protein